MVKEVKEVKEAIYEEWLLLHLKLLLLFLDDLITCDRDIIIADDNKVQSL